MISHTFKLIAPVVLSLTLIACGNDEAQADGESNEDSTNAEVSSDGTENNSDSPCDLFTVREVENMFGIGENIKLTSQDEVLTHPTCTYTWEDGKVTHSQEVAGQTIESKLSSKMMIVMGKKNAIDVDYNASIRVYQDAVSVSGVGKMATWSDKRAQLSFLAKGNLLHVHVRASNDSEENKAKAIEVANVIISRL